MTEGQWLTATGPTAMLDFLKATGQPCNRKVRLFACGCCRRVWHLLPDDERCRHAVEVAEGLADGLWPREALVRAYRANEALRADLSRLPRRFLWQDGEADAVAAVSHAASGEGASLGVENAETDGFQPLFEAAFAAGCAARALALTGRASPDLLAAQAVECGLLRDIVGNPFRSAPALSPAMLAWNGGVIVRLANAVYEHRVLPSGEFDRDRLAVLADALEEAGCTDPDILGHLRGPGPHVRGCWGVDLLLGKG